MKPNGWATIQIKGLPTIRLQTDERMPTDAQPKAIRITLKPRRMVVSLVYQQKPKDLGAPAKQSVGIDPGVKHNITAAHGSSPRRATSAHSKRDSAGPAYLRRPTSKPWHSSDELSRNARTA